MAYNNQKGPQHTGDIQYEGDPNETQIDFENDNIKLKTSGSTRLEISNAHVSASGPVSGSSFWGDGSGLTGLPSAAITSYQSPGNDRVIVGTATTTTVEGASDLTFDGSILSVGGQISASLGVTGSSLRTEATVIDATHVSSSLNVSASAFYGDGSALTGLPSAAIASYLNPAHNRIILGSTSTNTVSGAAGLDYNGTVLAVTGNISASIHVSASAFYGDGSNLTGLPGAAINTYSSASANRIITSVNATEVQGESNLTFNGSIMAVTGTVSAHDISSSVGIHITGSSPKLAIGDALGAGPQEGMLSIRPSDTSNKVLALMQAADDDGGRIALAVSGSGAITVGGNHLQGILNVTGSESERLISVRSDIHASLLEVMGSGMVGITNLNPKTALDVHHNPTLLANDTGGGEVVKFGTGTTTQGKTYYLRVDGAWDEVNYTVAVSGGLGMLATAIGSSPTTDGMLIRGFFDYNTYLDGSFVTGATVYIKSTGQLTTTRPTGSGEILRVVGTCTNTANVIYFNPSPDYLIIV